MPFRVGAEAHELRALRLGVPVTWLQAVDAAVGTATMVS
jgi:hypothetical protein